MLHREWINTGRVALGSFYARRFRRLTPALALMVTITMLVSAALLSPLGVPSHEVGDFARAAGVSPPMPWCVRSLL
jgi:peptidoglycan/LPS O-acetylase OafA/YrhL